MVTAPKARPSQFFNSLGWNFLLMSSLGIVGIMLLGFFMARMGTISLLETEQNYLQESSDILASAINQSLSIDTLQDIVVNLKKNTKYRITFISRDGTVFADTDSNPSTMENHANRPEVRLAIHGKAAFATRFSQTLGQEMLYYARPFGQQILRVAIPLHSVTKLSNNSLLVVFIVLLGASVIMALVSWQLYRRLIIPIGYILKSAEIWKNGYSAPMVMVSRPLELAEIFRSLRQLSADLTKKIEESTLRQQELERLFEAIREPVMVINHHQMIRSLNIPALEFINEINRNGPDKVEYTMENLQGKHLLTYIRSSELAQMIQLSLESGQARLPAIRLYGAISRQFGAYAAPVESRSADGEQLLIVVLYLETGQ